MARVKINKLPEGFKLVDGKVKKKAIKRDGGMTTGDQADYGLVTTPQEFYGSTNFNNTDDQSVRYSLSSVPREDANLEAEGGETVLTDLNGNNQFGLYDIKGPRHSSGGVPMFLPEQSFVFSDTNSMKFDKSEMAEFGIESRKKITPAKISKKYPLNQFYGEINSQYADDISTKSAELMLSKNMYNLSKLAFGQELKKDFEDGVPLASYPYLQEQGIDPIEFTAEIENQTKQQAQLEYIASLPPEQQDQILRLQAMMEQIENPNAGQSNQPNGQVQASQDAQDMSALASQENSLEATLEDGGELSMYQEAGETKRTYEIGSEEVDRATYIDYFIRTGMHRAVDGKLRVDKDGNTFIENFELTPEEEDFYYKAIQPEPREGWSPLDPIADEGETFSRTEGEETVTTNDDVKVTDEMVENASVDGTETVLNETVESETNRCTDYKCNPLPVGHPDRDAFETALNNGWQLTKVYDQGLGKTTFTVTKPLTKNKFEDFGDFEFENIEVTGTGDKRDVYTDLEKELLGVYQDGAFGDNVRVREGIYSRSGTVGTQSGRAGANSYGGDLTSDKAEKDFTLRWGDAIDKVVASGIDFDYDMSKGTWDRDAKVPVDAQAIAYQKQWEAVQNAMQEVENEFHYANFGENGTPRQLFPGGDAGKVDGKFGMLTFNKARSYIRTEDPESLMAELQDEPKDRPDPEDPQFYDKPDWWWQDVNNLATQNSLENPLFLPNIPRVPNTEIDYVLDDWTGRANMTNAALNTMAKNLRAFGKGKVAGSNLFGKAVNQLAKDVGSVNTNNIKIMNSVAIPQAQLNLRTGIANAKAYQDEYDGTVTALGRYTDFENWNKQKTNELYNQAITNRANTFNLNQLKDVMKVNPQDGGIVNMKDNKDLEVDPNVDISDQERRRNEYIKERNKMIEMFPDMKDDSLDNSLKFILDGYADNRRKKKVADDYNDRAQNDAVTDPQDLGYAPSVRYNAKRGNEIKKYAYPFYTGKMGA
tara:strand:+ start:2435 stop:5407 length:2973 start_codon:yes stop_codon:yes gene_type:complete